MGYMKPRRSLGLTGGLINCKYRLAIKNPDSVSNAVRVEIAVKFEIAIRVEIAVRVENINFNNYFNRYFQIHSTSLLRMTRKDLNESYFRQYAQYRHQTSHYPSIGTK